MQKGLTEHLLPLFFNSNVTVQNWWKRATWWIDEATACLYLCNYSGAFHPFPQACLFVFAEEENLATAEDKQNQNEIHYIQVNA